MKILMMMGGGDIGGAKTHIFSLVRELVKEHEVCVVSFRDDVFPREMMAEGIRVAFILEKNPHKARKKLLCLVDTMQPHLIHCHGGRANMMGAIVRASRDVPVMTTVHSDYRLDYLGSALKQYTLGTINAVSLRRLDGYQAVADRMAQTLIERGFSPYRVMTIYNGMDFSHPIEDFDRTSYCRKQWGVEVTDDMVLCGLAARLTAVKDIETAIRGFAKAAQEQPQLRMFLAGTGEDEDKLKQLAQQLDVTEKVVFCGWVTEIAMFFAAMDITLLTSLSETFPYSILEGIREGCVPVCSDVGGMGELIESGESGYIFQPRDVDALADALTKLASDREKRKKFAARQLERAAERYSLDAMRAAQERNYRTLLARFARKDRPRDGVVLCEHPALADKLARLRTDDPDQPICVVSAQPEQVRQQYRVDACTVREAERWLRRAERYVCAGGEERMIRLARRCGCRIDDSMC